MSPIDLRTRGSTTLRLAAVLATSGVLALLTVVVLLGTMLEGWAATVAAVALAQLSGLVLCRALVTEPLDRALRNARKKARRISTRLQEAQHIGKIGWWSYDFATDRLEASPEVPHLFGLAQGEFPTTNQGFLEMAHPEDLPAVRAAFAEALRTKTGYQVVYRAKLSEGRKWIHQRAQTTYNEQGIALRSVGTIQDVTETKEAERERSGFIGTVSHELRTPLTSILGSLSLLRGGALGELTPKMRSAVEMAAKNSTRLSKLVNDILDSERLAAGRMTMEMRPADLREIVGDAVQANDSYGQQLDVTYEADLPRGSVDILGDRDRLIQVLSNLLSNAAKFSDAGETVRVRLTSRDTMALIEVIDRGLGIPLEAQSTIFDRFTQAHGRAGRNATSSGLGLSIAKSIVEEHGGTLTFDSVEERGTTFRVSLPLAARRARTHGARDKESAAA